MKKRILPLLLCLCLTLALLPTSALATSAVNTVNLTLKAPQPNQMPTDADLPETASTVVTNTRWVSHHWGEGGKVLQLQRIRRLCHRPHQGRTG